jgi:hypothetical protein
MTEGTNIFFCSMEIVSLATSTGRWSVVAKGMRPSISSDGKRLAYVGLGGGTDCTQSLGPVVVREVDTRRERRWTGRQGMDGFEGDIMRLAWSPDSVHLALQRNIGDPYYEIRILDTRKGEDVLDARLISPGTESWAQPTYLDDHSLLVASSGSKGDGVDGEHIVYSINLVSGRWRTIVDLPAGVTSLDFDESREHLLAVSLDFTKGDFGRAVWVWHDGDLKTIVNDGPVIQGVW